MTECPMPINHANQVLLAHGGGGRLSQKLISEIFYPEFKNLGICADHDSALFTLPHERLAITTDSYVVRPIFFPGGDIGSLAVFGAINDLAMSGARARILSLAFILEEGFQISDLKKVVRSIRLAAQEADVSILTGDTKVVERGKGDGVFISVTGVGFVQSSSIIHPSAIQPGDSIIVSGDLGRHGVAVMAKRQGLDLEENCFSDCAPLWKSVEALLNAGVKIHCLRDLTRGGLTSALHEVAKTRDLSMLIEEELIPVSPAVRGVCELLGLDALSVANEGTMVCFVAAEDTKIALEALCDIRASRNARVIGAVQDSNHPSRVFIKSMIGVRRALDYPTAEQLPRIC